MTLHHYPHDSTPEQVMLKYHTSTGGSKRIFRASGGSCAIHVEWTAKFDGKDYPVKGDPARDAVSVKKIDDYTLEITNKKGGEALTTIRAVYARDGKTRTETTTGTNAQGQKVHNVTAWDKQ